MCLRRRLARGLACGFLSSGLLGCSGIVYVTQAAAGQFDLWNRATDIDEVLADPSLPQGTRLLLLEVAHIKAFAAQRGLRMRGNYEQYVAASADSSREFVVWFVNASAPLAFEPKLFSFPIVGSFPGLSWFSQRAAEEFADHLRAENWDVNVRGVRAYSTGGWFDDPILWTMFADGANALGYLSNLILHESVHATVLVKGQQYFNESLASFVADSLTPIYLARRYGSESEVVANYRLASERFERKMKLLLSAYTELDSLFQSSSTDAQKLRLKRQIYARLARDVEAEAELNNATLIGVQLYRVGTPEFQWLLDSCGRDWPRFMAAVSSLRTEHFGVEQQPDFAPVIAALASGGCQPLPNPAQNARHFVSNPARQHLLRGRRWPPAKEASHPIDDAAGERR